MLVCFWDCDGLLVKHLVPPNVTVNKEYYSMLLREHLAPALLENRPHLRPERIILQHDNARPHVARPTRETIQDLGWEVLEHPPYSPDLAPSDCFLFGQLKIFMQGRRFQSRSGLGSAIHRWAQSLGEDQLKRSYGSASSTLEIISRPDDRNVFHKYLVSMPRTLLRLPAFA